MMANMTDKGVRMPTPQRVADHAAQLARHHEQQHTERQRRVLEHYADAAGTDTGQPWRERAVGDA